MHFGKSIFGNPYCWMKLSQKINCNLLNRNLRFFSMSLSPQRDISNLKEEFATSSMLFCGHLDLSWRASKKISDSDSANYNWFSVKISSNDKNSQKISHQSALDIDRSERTYHTCSFAYFVCVADESLYIIGRSEVTRMSVCCCCFFSSFHTENNIFFVEKQQGQRNWQLRVFTTELHSSPFSDVRLWNSAQVVDTSFHSHFCKTD